MVDRAVGADRKLQLIVVTPEATALEAEVDFVAVPLYDGELGILPGRSPLIGRLGYGELRLTVGEEFTRYYVDGGFVQVAGDLVSVLTNRAVPATSLDRAAAEEMLAAARARKANSEELLAMRDRLEQQARVQIRIAQRPKRGSAHTP